MSVGNSRLKELINVARDGTDDNRRELLREITDVFMAAPDRYTSTELQHFDVIMSKVTEQVEISLRKEIAEKLADVKDAPKGLVQQLAHDEISVAQPILQRSPILSEEDLVRVVRQRGQGHMKAISQRREVPQKLTAELVERGNKDVLVTLAENQGAQFDSNAMEKMVDHSRTVKELQKPMTERFDLPPQLLTKMYFFVSSQLKREILQRSDLLDPAVIDQAVNDNRTKILSDAVRNASSEVSDARAFIAQKIQNSGITGTLLRELIESKKSTEFLLAFAHFIGVDTATAQRILKDKTFESVAICCRASHVERSTFAKIVFGLQKNEKEQNKALRILDLYTKIPEEAAERVMRFWRVRAQAAATRKNKDDGSGAKKRVKMHDIASHAAS